MKAETVQLALAETLLRSVTSPAQAENIAGDLLESARLRPGRFGRDVAGTVAGLAVHALTAHPGRTLRLLGASLGLWSVCYLGVRVALALPGWLNLSAASADCLLAGGWRGALLAGALLLTGLVTGAAVGGLARSDAPSPVLPLALTFVALAPALATADLLSGGQLTWHCLLTYFAVLPLCYALPLLTGAALARARRTASLEADA